MWSLYTGPNSHLKCTALSLRQLLYTAWILSLLFPAVECHLPMLYALGFTDQVARELIICHWASGLMQELLEAAILECFL